ncbi:MAG: IPT/TIG domain-containing protein [Bryobacteraceae bacterium]
MLLPVLFLLAQSDLGFPIYSSSSVANAAANVAGSYAANTLISIYGTNLAFGTAAITAADIRNGNLPTSLGSTPVRVLLDGQFASMYYVSPHQVNALIPPHLLPGSVTMQVVLSGRAGPPVTLELGESAPGLFETDDHYVIATHGNGPVVTAEFPAERGEVIVLYATGLGPTSPLTQANRIPTTAAKLSNFSAFQVWLNGVAIPTDHILYAGVTPGFAGLFQVNVQLPADAPPNPEIQLGTPDRMSPSGRYVRLR